MTLAMRILAAMTRLMYPVATAPGTTNIVYVEGMNLNGTPNANRLNAFDSIRTVLSVADPGGPELLGAWEATTHAGLYFEIHRLNPAGAFHIALGPQRCWIMGRYHDMEALLQALPIHGTRDNADNKFQRGSQLVVGEFGVHHHWGYNYPQDDVGRSSAGCQVGRTEAGHNEFIAILKKDPRYQADPKFIWTSTVLTASQVL
jgi:hypothetical protein